MGGFNLSNAKGFGDFSKTAAKQSEIATGETSKDGETRIVEIGKLRENPDNAKIFSMSEKEILDMVRSFKINGIKGSIATVYESADGESYEIVSGHKRIRAAKELGRTKVQVIVLPTPSASEKARFLIASNISQRHLSPIEYARAIQYFIENILMPQEATGMHFVYEDVVANEFGIKKHQVRKYLALTKLAPSMLELFEKYPEIPFTFVQNFKVYEMTEEQQNRLAEVINDNLTFVEETASLNLTTPEIKREIDIILGKVVEPVELFDSPEGESSESSQTTVELVDDEDDELEVITKTTDSDSEDDDELEVITSSNSDNTEIEIANTEVEVVEKEDEPTPTPAPSPTPVKVNVASAIKSINKDLQKAFDDIDKDENMNKDEILELLLATQELVEKINSRL